MAVKGGRLDFLAPHLLRSQLPRPGFVRMSLKLGAARQMPHWAKLQFTQFGVTPANLDRTLGSITSLESWVDEWESLGRAHEQGAHDALALGRPADAAARWIAASAAYNFAQYVGKAVRSAPVLSSTAAQSSEPMGSGMFSIRDATRKFPSWEA